MRSDGVFPLNQQRLRLWIEYLPRLYFLLTMLMVSVIAWRPLGGRDDFWVHAAIGRWIMQHGHVPGESLYLWGAKPIPWIYHSWLSQVSFYSLLVAGPGPLKPYLVLAFTVVMCALPFALLWYLWSRNAKPNILTPILFGMAILCSASRFHPRPELFSSLFLAYLLVVLCNWPDDRHKSAAFSQEYLLRPGEGFRIGLLAIMFMLWANYHGAVAIGLVILALTVVADLLQERFSGRSRLLAAVGIMCLAAVCFNPYGVQYFEALRMVRGEMFGFIDEWKPIYKAPYLTYLIIGEAVLAVVAFGVWLCNPNRRWAQLLWLLFMVLSFVEARRHLWTLALVSLAIIASNSAALDTERLWRTWRRLTQGGQKVGGAVSRHVWDVPIPLGFRGIARVGVVLILFVTVCQVTPPDLLTAGPVAKQLPEPMANFIQKRKLRGRIFNDYEHSSYLQWKFAGKPPLYIDMLNAYPDRLLTDYFDVIKATTRGRKILNQVNYVTLRPHKTDEGMATLAKYLDGNKKVWNRIYTGVDGKVWLRRSGPPGARKPVATKRRSVTRRRATQR